MTSDHAFGSDELTPELLRSATFDEQDGRIDAAEVRQFLDRAASSLEVFMSQDAPTALRAEFARNAEIAQQVLDAGQNAAEQLRRQAAEEAKRILDEARDATLGLRETVEAEIEQAREQVEAMRGAFIQDLRDLYDRIGASLYRFERAAEETGTSPIQEPTRAAGTQSGDTHVQRDQPAAANAPQDAGAPAEQPAAAAPFATDDAQAGDPQLPEGAKPPAWRQLPPEAWASGTGGTEAAAPPAAAPEAVAPPAAVPEAAAPPSGAPEAAAASTAPTPEPPVAAADPQPVPPATDARLPSAIPDAQSASSATDPFAVVEDQPLAPGEPLVDLRELAATPPAPAALDAENPATPPPAQAAGGSWLDAGSDAASGPAEPTPEASPQAGVGGSWLDAPAAPAEADVARDDALAEALIATVPPAADAAGGDPAAGATAPTAGAPPPGPAPAAAYASPDATAVRQQILDLLASGQSRENIEVYLSQQLGLLNPGALVDAALGSQP